MSHQGAGFLELSISDMKLDKTFMEKQVTIEVDVDNSNIDTIMLNKTSKTVKTKIETRDEIMELKILIGKAGKDADHVGKYTPFF
jgi:hypothetical protein